MRTVKRTSAAAIITLGVAVVAQPASAAATFFFSNTSYLSAADIPVGFYLGGAPTLLDTLEDGSLDASLLASTGSVIGPGQFNGARDSVDGDDGAIDGSGLAGRSWFSGSGSVGVTFTFTGAVLPTAFGVVWTDGSVSVTFSARDGDGNVLGSITESGFADGGFGGTTGEDRFFGVTSAGGIKSIFISNAAGGIEVDHLQYGEMVPATVVPLPAAGWLMLTAGAALMTRRRRVG